MGLIQLVVQIIRAFLNLRKAMSGVDRARVMMQDPVMAAYIRGDYRTAKSLAGDPFLRADMARNLGQFEEAEQGLRTFAQSEKNPKLAALIQSSLGEVLLEQKRYQEAMDCFQASLRLWPERGATYRDVAEVWLRRGDNPQEALRWARLAVEKEKAGPGVTEDTKMLNLGEDLATLAWAVAVHTHDATEVDRLSEEVALPGITPACAKAQVDYHFGKAWVELGDSRKSSLYFELAARTDPNGIWGRAAAAEAVPKA